MEENKLDLTGSWVYNTNEMNRLLGIDYSFDVDSRDLLIQGHRLRLYYLNFLIDSSLVTEVVKGMFHFEVSTENGEQTFFDSLIANLRYYTVSVVTDLHKLATSVLSGMVVIIVENSTEALVLDIRSYPNRSIAEPDTEKVVRGSRDGFTESIAVNIALIRRRIRTGKLHMEIQQIGRESKTDVCLCYIEGYVDPNIIAYVKQKLEEVKVVELTMSDKALEELMMENRFSPYPLVRYTERPDTLSVHLYQGMFAIIVDTSPSIILGPITIFDHMQHAEEYRQTPLAGTYLRILRFLGILASFLLVPLWFALLYHQNLINSFPELLRGLFEVKTNSRTVVFFQVILAEVGIEFLRMASIHTPNALSTAMGLVAGVIIGDIAIKVGLFTDIIVLLGSISAIGSYITPSYELSLANKMVKLLLLFVILFFGLWGLGVGLVVITCYLATLRSFSRPYLYPLIPFNFKQLLRQVIRYPYTNRNYANNAENQSANQSN